MVTETKEPTRHPGDTNPIADRFWKTLSGTLKSVSSDDRLRAALNAMVGEESIKSIKNHLVPTEIVSSLKGSLDLFLEAFRVELMSLLRDRLDGITEQVDIKKELLHLMAENRIELHATISLSPKEPANKDLGIQTDISIREKSAPPAPTKKDAKLERKTKKTPVAPQSAKSKKKPAAKKKSRSTKNASKAKTAVKAPKKTRTTKTKTSTT